MTTLAALSLHFPFVWYGFRAVRRWAAQCGDLSSAAHVDPDRGRRADNPQHPGIFLPAVPPADLRRDNIPLLSFSGWAVAPAAVRRPSRGYPLTELATGLLFILAGALLAPGLPLAGAGAALVPADTGAD
ncbi:hypothetical protein J4734_13650 [Klebsiella pneumoniae]|uniref:Uncharacterized protein n=1 Tax=Klebsiella pneumoniae TaxID=573 RepID=A0A939NRZ4_KLEPN|nr:hypothetical protein [Klebsiella pneumoniae]